MGYVSLPEGTIITFCLSLMGWFFDLPYGVYIAPWISVHHRGAGVIESSIQGPRGVYFHDPWDSMYGTVYLYAFTI